jgi:TRAP-type mannitol/chloroaromatic compound transport system substrate-binding protein
VITWVNQCGYTIGLPVPDRWAGWGYVPNTASAPYIFADFIEGATNGRLKIETHPPDAIVPSKDILRGVGGGTLDAGVFNFAGNWTGVIPEAEFDIGAGFLWENAWEHFDFYWNWKGNELLNEAYGAHNVMRVSYPQAQIYSWFTNFDPSTPEAFEGRKIRSWGFNANYLRRIGASPIAIPGPEVYMAVKLGTVDGCLWTPEGAVRDNIHEVTEWLVTKPTCALANTWLFNVDSVNALPPDLREIFDSAMRHLPNTMTVAMNTADAWALNYIVGLGETKTVQWSREDQLEAVKVGVDVFEKEIAIKSPGCKKLVDQLKLQLADWGKM